MDGISNPQEATMMDITAVLAGSITVLCLVLIYAALIAEWQR
jgi:hypothetical protein